MSDLCEHDKRFAGVFFLPKEDRGCVACGFERLQAREEKLLEKGRLLANESMNLDADVAKLQAREELLEKVVEAASACLAAWDDAKWPSPIPLRKAIAALKEPQ